MRVFTMYTLYLIFFVLYECNYITLDMSPNKVVNKNFKTASVFIFKSIMTNSRNLGWCELKHHKTSQSQSERRRISGHWQGRLGGEVSLYSRSNVNHVIREHLAVLSEGILKPNSKPFFRYCDRPLNCHVGLPSGMTPCLKDQILKNIEQYLIGDINNNLLSSVHTSSKLFWMLQSIMT